MKASRGDEADPPRKSALLARSGLAVRAAGRPATRRSPRSDHRPRPSAPRPKLRRSKPRAGARRRLDLLAVIAPQGLVADRAERLAQAPLERGAALRRVERPCLGLARPEEVDERPRAVQAPARSRPGRRRAARSSGSCPSGRSAKRSDLPGGRARQGKVDRAVGGAAPGPVAVEAQDRLVGEAPDERELVLGQRRAERRDGVREARHRHRDHVDIALDRDDGAALMRRLSGLMEVVEEPPLVEERRVGRIEVFRRHVGAHGAAAEGDHPAAPVGDREHHPVAEAVVRDGDVLARYEETRLDHDFGRDALAGEVVAQARSAPARRSRCGSRAGSRPRGRAGRGSPARRRPPSPAAAPRRSRPRAPSPRAAICGGPPAHRPRATASAARRRPRPQAARPPPGRRAPRSPSGT